MVSFYVYLAVIVSGASVLAIEMLGTRILGPFYGVSLYLWSALISVTLAALSTGYALGGRWADRGPTLRRFALLLGLAGVWIALVPWLRGPLLFAVQPLGLRAAVLLGATLLFFPPLALLGMVSPYAIRLKTKSLDTVGTTAGNLYAVSTVASVVSAVATGFVLIPNIGVYSLVFIIGILLMATGGLVMLTSSGRKAQLSTPLIFIAAAALIAWATPAQTADTKSGVVAVQQSPYGEIRVFDYEGARHLIIDGGTHTIVDQETGESHFSYVNVLDLAKGYFELPGHVLLIGLGGGTVAHHYADAGWHVDAVEIDPVIIKMAHTYFGLKENETTIYEMDARQYLLTHNETYDLIILDAFGSSSIPFHLVTAEAFDLLHSRLRPGGVLAMNTECVGWDDVLIRSLTATLHTHFENVLALPIAEPPNQLGNVVLLAADRSLELPVEPPVPKDRFSGDYDRAHAWDNRFQANTSGAPVLTDNLNPVDIWAERINLEARKQLREYFKESTAVW